jgi:hypothetical protein
MARTRSGISRSLRGGSDEVPTPNRRITEITDEEVEAESSATA